MIAYRLCFFLLLAPGVTFANIDIKLHSSDAAVGMSNEALQLASYALDTEKSSYEQAREKVKSYLERKIEERRSFFGLAWAYAYRSAAGTSGAVRTRAANVFLIGLQYDECNSFIIGRISYPPFKKEWFDDNSRSMLAAIKPANFPDLALARAMAISGLDLNFFFAAI